MRHGLILIQACLFIACLLLTCCKAEIYDPLNVFCGPVSCYDVLGVARESSSKEIKKAYRKLSLTHHPDKNQDKANATETFRIISKAYEVLSGNESRPLFDYYLDHPKDYFKVSGQHYYRNLPKSDVRLVILVVLGLLSWLFHHIQRQKYEKLVKYLRHAILNNLTLKNGGSKQTMELFDRATELYAEKLQDNSSGKKEKSVNKNKMLKDPLFEEIADKMISELKIEGGYKKPEWEDLLIVRLVMFPFNFVSWAKTYHRRYHSNQPLSMEDKTEMARARVGYGTWEESTPEERDNFIAMEVWKPGVFEAWLQEREEEELKRLEQLAAKNRKSKKKNRRRVGEDEEDDDGWVE